jgi:hypothetical protein
MSLVGRLEDLALSDIFQILSIGKKTGTLMLRGSRGNACVVFKNGLVVRAETDDIDGTIGEELVKVGTIKDTVLNLALEVKKKLPTKSIAEILLDFGAVTPSILDKITRKRIEKIIYKLVVWEDGDFQFELDKVDPSDTVDIPDTGWEITKGMSPEYLLMEGARVHDEESQMTSLSAGELTGAENEAEGFEWEEDWDLQPPTERKDIISLKSLTQELRFPTSASEITLLILRFASEIFQRGILFMVGDNEMIGLGQFGLEIENPDEKIREIVLPYDESDFLKNIITERRSHRGPLEKDSIIETIIRETGGTWPNEAGLFPVIAEERTVALLYCDNIQTGEKFAETEGLEIFIDQAGLALEKSLLQRRIQEFEKRSQQ